MMRFQLVCLAVLSTAGCDNRTAPNGPRPTTSPTAPTATLPTTLDLSGTVVEIGGEPVSGATVSARSCDDTPSYSHVFGETLTDDGGTFRLTIGSGSPMPIGCAYLSAEKSGYVRALEEERTLAEGLENITLRLQRHRRVTGRVVEVDGGSPVSSVGVSTGSHGTTSVGDANGFFVLNGVGNSFILERNGYVRRTVAVPQGQDVDLGPVRLQRAIQIAAGASLTSQISSTDVYYDDFFVMWDDGVFCSPCKSIDLQTRQQDLEIRLEWSGETPLALWAAGPAYEESRSRPAPGASSLSMAVPANTTVLLVGIPSAKPGQQTVEQPVRFELTANAR